MSKIDLDNIPERTGSIYPGRYADEMKGRSSLRIGAAGGLTQFGANLIILQPGAKSSLRHWHVNEDEFVMVTEGVVQLVTDDGETEMGAGDCAAFPANVPNGHCFINRSGSEARFLVVGTSAPEETAFYADIDMKYTRKNGQNSFTRKDGSPLPDDI